MTIGAPSTAAQGTIGTIWIGGLRAGTLTQWRVVISPSTGQPTLFGTGRIGRYYAQAAGGIARLELTPTPIPTRIGRKPPPVLRPFVLIGTIAELTSTSITISHGEIARD